VPVRFRSWEIEGLLEGELRLSNRGCAEPTDFQLRIGACPMFPAVERAHALQQEAGSLDAASPSLWAELGHVFVRDDQVRQFWTQLVAVLL
jgi:hypothetical protein